MSRIITILTLIIVIIAGLALHLRNNQPVVLDYYLNTQELSLSLVIVGAVFFGALLGILASLPIIIKLKHANIRLGRQARLTGEELNNLRALPISDRPARNTG